MDQEKIWGGPIPFALIQPINILKLTDSEQERLLGSSFQINVLGHGVPRRSRSLTMVEPPSTIFKLDGEGETESREKNENTEHEYEDHGDNDNNTEDDDDDGASVIRARSDSSLS